MPRPLQIKFNKHSGDYFELFFISAVSTIFLIRSALYLLGYPQLSGAGLHIAHVLWGGLFMCMALILALSFSGKRILQTVAILGGIGFGTFVDELGKFVTADNNYFFQPAIAIVYLIFLLLFFLTRFILNHGHLVEDPLENIYHHRLQIITRVRRLLNQWLKKIATSIWFQRGVVVTLFFKGIFGMIEATYTLIIALFWTHNLENWAGLTLTAIDLSTYLSGVLEVTLAAIGVYYFKRQRLKALTYFKYSLLVAILLRQFFLFYQNQLGETEELFFELISLIVVRTMIFEEKQKQLTKQ